MKFEDMINNIILGDCMDYLKEIPDKSIDLVLTDPPYGLGIDFQKKQKCKNPKHNRKEHIKENWDNEIPKKELFDELKRISKKMIIFGGNYFNEYLEQGHKGWIIWDKGQRNLTMSDCEIIYTNFDMPTRIITVNRCELKKDITFHPTQKPLKLIMEIIKKYSNENDLVLDCFAGSGVTLEACRVLNRKFIGIEKNKNYYFKAKDRINGIRPNGQYTIFAYENGENK